MVSKNSPASQNEWQRAHSPEQKEQRKTAILTAAAALFQKRRLSEISIAEVAERAGLAKGSVYRYFRTKEEVFLELLRADLDVWFDALLAELAAAGRKGRAPAVASSMVKSLRPYETMLRLLAALFSDIEPNLSLKAARSFKRWALERVGAAGVALEAALPGLPTRSGAQAILHLHALIAGLWPMSHPLGNMKKVLATPEMAPLRVEFFTELEAALSSLLVGMASERKPSSAKTGEAC